MGHLWEMGGAGTAVPKIVVGPVVGPRLADGRWFFRVFFLLIFSVIVLGCVEV